MTVGNSFVRVLLCGLGGLLVLLGGVLLYEQVAGTSRWPAIELTGDKLMPMSSLGVAMEEGIEIRGLESGDRIIVLAALEGVPAERYGRVEWDVLGLDPEQEVSVIWTSTAATGRDQARSVTARERTAARVDLRNDPAWAGRIQALGFSIGGPSHEPVIVKHLRLRPDAPTWRETLEAQVEHWRRFEPWHNRSINQQRGGTTTDFAPAVTVAIWIALSSLLYLLISRTSSMRATASAFAALIVIGWLVLDVHWQWELGTRLSATYARYGALAPSERLGAVPDKALLDAADRIREQLPPEPERLFVIGANPQGYSSARLGYHLLPHRVYRGMTDLPSPEQVRPGEFILLLVPTQRVRYDRELEILSDERSAVPAELIVALPRVGGLFRVQGEAAP